MTNTTTMEPPISATTRQWITKGFDPTEVRLTTITFHKSKVVCIVTQFWDSYSLIVTWRNTTVCDKYFHHTHKFKREFRRVMGFEIDHPSIIRLMGEEPIRPQENRYDDDTHEGN